MFKKIFAVFLALMSFVVISVTACAETTESAAIDVSAWDSALNSSGSQRVYYDDARNWLASYLGKSYDEIKAEYSIKYIHAKQVLIASDCKADKNGIEHIYQFYYNADKTLCVNYIGSDGFVSVLAGGNYSSVSEVITDVSQAGRGVFSIGTMALDFMLSNALCFLCLGSSFCFTAVALARRSLRISKRG